MVNPLDDTPKILHDGSGYFQYYLKIVPTIYEYAGQPALHTNQFSYTELFRTTHELNKFPAVYFHYELSPIMAKVAAHRARAPHAPPAAAEAAAAATAVARAASHPWAAG